MTQQDRTWSIYCDVASMLYDAIDEGDEPAGASGSNWQYGYTAEEARRFCEEREREGWSRDSRDRNPRY